MCSLVVEALAQWQLVPGSRVARPAGGRTGRPRALLREMDIEQAILFVACELEHLRRLPLPGPVRHLTGQDMVEWRACWGSVQSYLREQATWGDEDIWVLEPGRLRGVISASRQREHAVWQAARRVVADLSGVSERTLRRRIREWDYYGERRALSPPIERVCVVCGGERAPDGRRIGVCVACTGARC